MALKDRKGDIKVVAIEERDLVARALQHSGYSAFAYGIPCRVPKSHPKSKLGKNVRIREK
jgi:hypothetical protein